MRKIRKWVKSIVQGLLWAAIPTVAAWLLLQYSGQLTLWIGTYFEMDLQTIDQVAEAMDQLKTAAITLPWVAILCAALCWGCLWRAAIQSKAGRAVLTVLGILLLLPATVGVLWLTKINGIQLGALLESVLPMLKEVL